MSAVQTIPGGLFVSLEGPECSGKSTQSTLLVRALRGRGYEVLETREPGGTVVGEELRRLVKHVCGEDAVCEETELLLFCASRAQLVRKKILPVLNAGGVVVCDRFADSTTAYQGYGRGFDLELVQCLHQLGTAGRWPDLTLLLDLDVDSMRRRGQMRLETLLVQDRLEEESRRFHEIVRNGYLQIARQAPERVKVIDATLEQQTIHRQIMEHIDRALAEHQ